MKQDSYDIISEFDSIWQNMEEIVASHVIADLHAPFHSVLNIQSAYDELVVRWTRANSREQVWLEAVRQQDSDKAEHVLQCAKSLQIKQATAKPKSMWPFRIYGIVGALAITFLLFWILNTYIYIGSYVAILIFMLSLPFTSARMKSEGLQDIALREKQIVNEYRAQLNKVHDEIVGILQ